MPSKSGKQHRLMAMVAHDPKAAKRLGIPQSVGKEFTAADKGKKFKEGGMASNKLKKMFKGKETYAEELKEAKAIKSGKISPEEYAKGEKDIEGHKCGGRIKKYAAGGSIGGGTKDMPEAKKMGAMGMKCGGKVKKFVGGGQAESDKPTPEQAKQMRQQVQDMRQDKATAEAYKKASGKKFARGGGIEVRGKTRGKLI